MTAVRDDMARYLLEIIRITPTLMQRIEEIFWRYGEICPEEIKRVFISEYRNSDGVVEYEGLWLFSEHFVMEAKNFAAEDDFDITPIRGSFSYIHMSGQDYDWHEATSASRMSVEAQTGESVAGLSCTLKATGMNCDELREITKKYFIANVREYQLVSDTG